MYSPRKRKKIKEYKHWLRLKGKVMRKGATKKGNITLNVKKDENNYKFTILKSHKERFTLAEKLKSSQNVSIESIPKFKMIICTRLKIMEKGIPDGKQARSL